MPGLYGVVTIESDRKLRSEFAGSTLRQMQRRLSHQDFYTSDQYLDATGRFAVGRIGHPHLVSPHRQEDGSRPSDFAVAFYGLLEYSGGKGCSHRAGSPDLAGADGNFSAILYNTDRTRIFLAVDRLASEPLYYLQQDGLLFFAPEVKALLDHGDPGPVDEAAVASLLANGNLYPHQTLFAGIHKLPSGHHLGIEGGRVVLAEYWQYKPGSAHAGQRPDDLARELASLVDASVRRCVDDPDQTMTFISGGLDSRYILACLVRNIDPTDRSIHAVTWGEGRGVPGADPEVAEKVVRALGGVDHSFIQRKSDRYGEWFKEVSYLLDGMSEVAAFHPYEYQIMKSIRSRGFTRVIRGDEALGFWGRRYSHDSALATIGFRPFHKVKHLSTIVRPKWYAKMNEAARADFDALKQRFVGFDPNMLKDSGYVSHRLSTRLSQASYYKQIVFDHRSPLLAKDILDFYQFVPNALRYDKKLFYEAFGLDFPELSRLPYAGSGGLEDWGTIMSGDTALHHFVHKELNDTGSGVWEILDRQTALQLFSSLGHARGDKKVNPIVKAIRSTAGRLVDHTLPARIDRVRCEQAQSRMPVSTVLLRTIVLKNWYDEFFYRR